MVSFTPPVRRVYKGLTRNKKSRDGVGGGRTREPAGGEVLRTAVAVNQGLYPVEAPRRSVRSSSWRHSREAPLACARCGRSSSRAAVPTLLYLDVKKDMYRITPLAFANLLAAQDAYAKAEQEVAKSPGAQAVLVSVEELSLLKRRTRTTS